MEMIKDDQKLAAYEDIERMVYEHLGYIEQSRLLKKKNPTRADKLNIAEILGRQTALEWVRSIIESY